jgi:hypothetical protein
MLSWHFVGTASLAGNTNGSQARGILAQPASQRLVGVTLDKLARAPGTWLNLAVATNAAAAAQLRPWFEEMLTAESCGDFAVGANGESDFVAAVRAPDGRASTLESRWIAWANAVGGTPPAEIKVGTATARETRLAGTAGWSRFGRVGGWALIGVGKGPGQSFADLAARVGAVTAPTAWLSLRLGGTPLARAFGWSTATHWPDISLDVAGRGPILRTTARLSYAQPLEVKFEPWKLPEHTIGDPVVSFTAVQGIRPWLSTQAWWKQLGLPSTPNQAVAWTMGEIPFASYVAWQMPSVASALTELHPRASAFLSNNIPRIRYGEVAFQTNLTRLSWAGLPVMEPFLSPAAEKDEGFALAGLFPIIKPQRPLPPELLSQINGRTNLVLYDWELTAQRVSGWRHVKGLYRLLAGYTPPPTNYAGEAWLSDTNVMGRLGNTGTEVTLISPRELAALRNSSLGLTGLELVALLRWLDDPAFPSLSEPQQSAAALRRLRGGSRPATGSAPKPGAAPPPSPRSRPPASPAH